MSKVMRTHPDLWEICKKEAVFKLGKFSARAMQHAVVLHKERGGGYEGTKSQTSSLVRWNRNQSSNASSEM